MARRLPTFAAVRAFEAAARHGNLRLAGEELSLTVSAISHQIKSLEGYLGAPLFVRSKNALHLTPAARDYALELTRALDTLQSATARVEQERRPDCITINLFPSLASLWLLPRLTTFRKLEPDVDVRVITTLDPIDFRGGLIDLAIRYADTPPQSARTTKMFPEQAFPVCAPSYGAETGSIDTRADLTGLTLIRTQTLADEWTDWFSFTGFKGKLPGRYIDVDSRALALEAAIDGLGVAMGRTPFVNRALATGRLRRLSKRTMTDGKSYYLAETDSALRSRVNRRFSEWLLEQAAMIEPVSSNH